MTDFDRTFSLIVNALCETNEKTKRACVWSFIYVYFHLHIRSAVTASNLVLIFLQSGIVELEISLTIKLN